MTGSSPADLAVAFRSFPRRTREALDEADDEAGAAALAAEVGAAVAAAAGRLGVRPGADLAATSAAVAERIVATRAQDWDEVTLEDLRERATAIAAVIRRIEALRTR